MKHFLSFIRLMFGVTVICIAVAFLACTEKGANHYQGYAEGEFVLVAAPNAGRLEKRWVSRGQEVEVGAPLFALEEENERADRRGAGARMHNAEARLADLRISRRSSEIAALEAAAAQAQADLKLSSLQLERQEKLFQQGFISREQLDEALANQTRDLQRVAEAEARLTTSRESIGRDKEIVAAQAEVDAARAELSQSDWRLAQRAIHSSAKALVQDTFYSEGEWVQAGSPVVSLLPPANLKLRFFVPESVVGSIKVGQRVTARCDGCSSPIEAKVSFVSRQPEYTPPVIYSQEQRVRLVFLIEARPEPAGAELLHPGQPLDVELR
ncbi:MAG TPA: HlyD family efflux transporter periplasmic adaptor subunit [Thermodesulfovibrionales bacterium]|nr:HlyD family efflux transporter periplasmic adaptor subunit [Thermodesulfovibrionales bacterium]